MGDSFITVNNVCEVARLLLFVDTYSIKPKILEDSEDFIVELKTALDNFNEPFNGIKYGRYSHTLLFDKHLSELLNATKNLYNILTDEAKDILQRFIADKNTDKKNVFIPLND